MTDEGWMARNCEGVRDIGWHRDLLAADAASELCSATGFAWLVEHVDNSAVVFLVLDAVISQPVPN